MKTKLFATAAFAAMGLYGTSAMATTTVVDLGGGESLTVNAVQTGFKPTAPGGYVMIDDFDGVSPPAGFTFTNNNVNATSAALDSSISAPPPGDNTAYETVLGQNNLVGSATLSSAKGFTDFSYYMGSPDNYNNVIVSFNGPGGTHTLSGVDIWGGVVPQGGFGTRSDGYLLIYSFKPGAVTSLTFTSTQNSFEFDNLAVGVPEPTSWALMILGFGAAGAMLRGKRRLGQAA